MVFENVFGVTVRENLIIAVIIIIIFVILFEILSKLNLFKKKGLAALVAFIIVLLSLQFGYTRKLAILITQVLSGTLVIVISILLIIGFIFFIVLSLKAKKFIRKK